MKYNNSQPKVRWRRAICKACGKQVRVPFRYGYPVIESLKRIEKTGWTINLDNPKKSLCTRCTLCDLFN